MLLLNWISFSIIHVNRLRLSAKIFFLNELFNFERRLSIKYRSFLQEEGTLYPPLPFLKNCYLNHIAVPGFAWYLRIRIGWGTGRSPTRVPCWRNLKISLSSVKPLSIHIFSTCGTRTWGRILWLITRVLLGRNSWTTSVEWK